MKFSELEDGEKRLERFKQELELERQERQNQEARKWLDRMPWIMAAAIGWAFFFMAAALHR